MASYSSTKGAYEIARVGLNGATLFLVYVNTAPANEAAVENLNVVTDITSVEHPQMSRDFLASLTVTEVDASDLAMVDAADPSTHTAVAVSAAVVGAYLCKQVAGSPVDANDLVLAFLDSNDVTPNGGDITVAVNASGLLTLT